jgi:hypothetical protein
MLIGADTPGLAAVRSLKPRTAWERVIETHVFLGELCRRANLDARREGEEVGEKLSGVAGEKAYRCAGDRSL